MLIQGWNHDSNRANGAGKTAIFNALTFALYDRLPRKITATEILRRGCKSGNVEVRFEVGGNRHVVRRSRPKGFSYYRGEDTSVDPTPITQEELESVYKLNYKQFTMVAYCTQGSTGRFLSVNDADKKTFLLQLLNLAEFAAGKTIADEKAKALTKEFEDAASKIATMNSKISAYSESLVDEDTVLLKIEQSTAAETNFTNEIIQLQLIPKPDLSKYQKLEDDVVSKKNELTKAKTRREMLHEQYRKTSSKIRPFNGSSTCSSCGSKIDTSTAKAAHCQETASFEVELQSLKEQIDACDEALLREKQLNELHSKLREKKKLESYDYEVSSIKITELQSKIALKQQEIKNLNVKLQNNSDLHNKIKALELTCVQIANTQGGIRSKIELYKTVSAMYSPTGAQAYILDSVIESFNERIVEYVNLLWSNMTYELQSYKENVSGDMTAKFSELLMMDGKEISIGSLSGGEYRALSLCVDFALTDVLERQFGILVSPIILDEPFEGLDSIGRELIIDLLEALSKDRQIVIIDHVSEIKSMFSKVLMVEKRSGISSINLES
jgi:DNA repair exonuclease SbcCD ATPase subunit